MSYRPGGHRHTGPGTGDDGPLTQEVLRPPPQRLTTLVSEYTHPREPILDGLLEPHPRRTSSPLPYP